MVIALNTRSETGMGSETRSETRSRRGIGIGTGRKKSVAGE